MDDIDWDYWSLMKSLKTWQMALLSLGIDPAQVRQEHSSSVNMVLTFPKGKEISKEKHDEVIKRKIIIENNLSSAGYSYGVDSVDLVKFINWAKANNLPIPKELDVLSNIFVIEKKDLPEEWKELVKIKTLEYHKKGYKFSERNASYLVHGYILALVDLGYSYKLPSPNTIVREVYSKDQWWVNNIKELRPK
jgi:hypothetical protein